MESLLKGLKNVEHVIVDFLDEIITKLGSDTADLQVDFQGNPFRSLTPLLDGCGTVEISAVNPFIRSKKKWRNYCIHFAGAIEITAVKS